MNQSSAIARETLAAFQAGSHDRRRRAVADSAPVLLLLDTKGAVRFCSDPAALQRADAETVGRHVGELIEGLPLRPTTPGYNVAWVRFAFGGDTRRRLALRLPEGGVRPIDVGVRPLRMDRAHCLLVELRFANGPAAPAADPVRLYRRPAAAEATEPCC